MPTYAELKESFEERIKELEERANILEKARDPNTPISQIEFKKINRKTDELEPEEIAFILQSKHDSRAKKGVLYEPILLKNQEDIEKFNQLLAEQPKNKAFHYDVIIQQQDSLHRTPMQIHSDGKGEVRIFSVDAYYGAADKIKMLSGEEIDLTNASSIKLFENTLGTKAEVYSAGNLQKDFMSCSIFSIQDLNSMSNLGVENLSQYLTPSSSVIEPASSRKKLHPRFIKNAQSMETISQYIQEHAGEDLFVDKNSRKTLQEHLENHSINIEVASTIEDARGELTKIRTVKKVN